MIFIKIIFLFSQRFKINAYIFYFIIIHIFFSWHRNLIINQSFFFCFVSKFNYIYKQIRQKNNKIVFFTLLNHCKINNNNLEYYINYWLMIAYINFYLVIILINLRKKMIFISYLHTFSITWLGPASIISSAVIVDVILMILFYVNRI